MSISLSEILRPKQVSDWLGWSALEASYPEFTKSLVEDRLDSCIFYGPPGSGKTSLANLVRKQTKKRFFQLNAVMSGVKDLRETFDQAKAWRMKGDQESILFIDEIHRFNKAQQDALLQAVELKEISLLGATTENPSFELNAALLSRCRVIVIPRLAASDLVLLLEKGLELLSKSENTLKREENILELIAENSDADARQALRCLEDCFPQLTSSRVAQYFKKKFLKHDRSAEMHHEIISAFIKSMRASEVDAALYYLARLWEVGEDPKYIVRRMFIFASEDIGNADLKAIAAMNSIKNAVDFVGRPECFYALSQGVILLSQAKKSREAGDRFAKALQLVKRGGSIRPPRFLTNAVTGLDRQLGKGGSSAAESESFLPKELGADSPFSSESFN